MIPVSVRPKPIDPSKRTFLARPGQTIAEIVAEAMLPPEAEAFLVVRLNESDSPIPREWWPHIRVKDCSRIHIAPVYGGGGGAAAGAGGKSGGVLSMLGLLGSLIPGIGPFGQLAIGLGLTLAAAALSKKPKSIIGENDSPGAQPAAGFSANQLAPYDQIPMVLGQVRVAPYLLTTAWTEFYQRHIAVSAVVGLQGAYEIVDIRSNGVLIDDVDQVEYETFDGDGTAAFTLFDHVGITDEVGSQLSQHDLISVGDPLFTTLRNTDAYPKWYSFLSKDSPDEIVMNIQFPNGHTTLTPTYQHFRFRIRLKGEIAWRNLPEMQIRPIGSPYQIKVKLKWFGSARLGNESPDQEPSQPALETWHVYSDKGQTAAGIAAWTADSYFFDNLGPTNQAGHVSGKPNLQANSDDDDGGGSNTAGTAGYDFIVWLHVDEFPQGKYEVQLKRSGITGGAEATGTNQGRWNTDGTDRVDPFLFKNAGVDDYRLAPSQSNSAGIVFLHSITYKWFESPLQRPDTLGVAFKITDTQIDHLTTLCISKALIPGTGTDVFSDVASTNNPAALWRKVLLDSTINHRPLSASLIDDEFLTWWYDYCASNELTCNCIVESGNIDDILPVIARAGDAFKALTARDWRVWVDRDRSGDSPTIVWSPRNTRNFMMKVSFEPVPDVIRATFLDEDDDYAQREIFVNENGEIDTPADDDEVLAIDTRGITGREKVIRYCRREIKRGYLRRRTYSWETNVANLAVDLGDLNGIAHDVLAGYFGWGYVIDVERSGGEILSLTLDADVRLPGSTSDILAESDILEIEDIFAFAEPHVIITLRDGSGVVEAQVHPGGKTNTLVFDPPITDNALIDLQCHVAVAAQSQLKRRVIIIDKQPGPDLTARLTAKDEAPEIFTETT